MVHCGKWMPSYYTETDGVSKLSWEIYGTHFSLAEMKRPLVSLGLLHVTQNQLLKGRDRITDFIPTIVKSIVNKGFNMRFMLPLKELSLYLALYTE